MAAATRLQATSALIGALMLALTGCGGSEKDGKSDGGWMPSAEAPASSATPTLDPTYEMPRVGECRSIKKKAIPPRSNDAPTVPCRKPHTAVTMAVVKMPAGISRSTPKKAYKKLAPACSRAYIKMIGGNAADRALVYGGSWGWFMPTKAQEKHGARWGRCDLVVYGPKALTPLPRKTPFITGHQVPDWLRKCMAGADDAIVPCSRPHAYRAVGSFLTGSKGQSYPSKDKQRQIASDRCHQMVGGSYWGWSFPDKDTWKVSAKVRVVCYSSTTS